MIAVAEKDCEDVWDNLTVLMNNLKIVNKVALSGECN
jgi:hypothetical protein